MRAEADPPSRSGDSAVDEDRELTVADSPG